MERQEGSRGRGRRIALVVATAALALGIVPALAPVASAMGRSPTPITCEGAAVCMGTYADLRQAGFDIGGMRAADRQMLASHSSVLGPRVGVTATTSYSAWLNFYLYAGTNCTGTVNASNRCGWLYHKYTTIVNGVPKPGVMTTAYPARSGNNNPAQDWTPNVGPIPNEYGYRWGFMNGAYTGFESDATDTFYPGKWRLDPWSVTRNGVTRGQFEIHGGINGHSFWTTGTQGCIRLPSDSITSLKSMWNNRTSNMQGGAPLSIYY